MLSVARSNAVVPAKVVLVQCVGSETRTQLEADALDATRQCVQLFLARWADCEVALCRGLEEAQVEVGSVNILTGGIAPASPGVAEFCVQRL